MSSLPPANKVLGALTSEARKSLVSALDHGDKWGYRCFHPADEKAVLIAYQGRKWTWGDIASKGFLTPLGFLVAKAALGGQKPVREL